MDKKVNNFINVIDKVLVVIGISIPNSKNILKIISGKFYYEGGMMNLQNTHQGLLKQ